MKRLAIGFGVASAVVFLGALVSGLLPASSGDCTGSFFMPMRGSGWESNGGSVSLASLCNVNGYPSLFWTLTTLGVAMLIAAIVFQQVAAHKGSATLLTPVPSNATAVVAPTLPPFQPAPPYPAAPAPFSTDVASELKSLKDLYDVGGLTADEFAAAKARVLRGPSTP